MSPLNFLLCLLVIRVSCQTSTTPNPLEVTNNYLRSFFPWWPTAAEEASLRAAPIADNLLSNSTALDDDLSEENGTLVEDVNAPVEPIDPVALRVQEIPQSPLDDFHPAPKSVLNSDDQNFIINFDEMSECPRDCSNDLKEALNIAIQEMSHIERYHRICGKYKGAQTCVNEDARCDNEDRGMFEMMTSGLHYMCVEQELAFNATIQCIDNEAGLVQSECENQCQTKNLFMNWIMRSTMQNTIQQGVNEIVGAATGTNPNPLGLLQGDGAGGNGWADMLGNIAKPPTPESSQQGLENFRQFTNDLCKIGDCMLDCIRSKFNTRCEGSAGTLLSEVLVRPIAASQNKLSMIRPVMGMFMPEHCSFLHNNADLQKHRIGSTMDEELKRMYTEKAAKELRERTEQDELLSNLVPLDESGVPLPRALPELQPHQSPLDVSARTLDQLILDMYSKNERTAVTTSEEGNVTAAFLEETTTITTTTTETVTTTVASTTTTDAPVPREAVVATRGMVYAEENEEASGMESSGEGSGADQEESSGISGIIEASGELLEESSGEASGEASGVEESSGEETEGSSGFSGDDDSSGSGIEDSSGYSGDVTL